MDMEMMNMMMRYHHDLYRYHCCLANQHHQVSQTQMQIANLNQQMYMHMMHEMEEENNNGHSHSSMGYYR